MTGGPLRSCARLLADRRVVLVLVNRARNIVLPAGQRRLVLCGQMAAIGAAHRMLLAVHAGFAALQIPRLPRGKLTAAHTLARCAPAGRSSVPGSSGRSPGQSAAPVNSVQSAAAAKKRRAVMWSLLGCFWLLASPGFAWALREETRSTSSMFRATFCQSDGRNQMRSERWASVTCARRLRVGLSLT